MTATAKTSDGFGQTARGAVLLSAAQAFMMATGFLLHYVLARLLGLEDYGRLAVVFSLLSWAELVVSRIFPQATAHFIATNPAAARATFATALRWQLGLVASCCLAMFFAAPEAAAFLGDRKLEAGVRLAALSIPCCGLYHLYVHRIGGLRGYGSQTLVILLYSATKVIATYAFACWTGNWILALAGNIAASAVGAAAARLSSKPLASGGPGVAFGPMIRYGTAALVLAGIVILFQSMGMYSVSRLSSDPTQVGLYAAALTLANVPLLAVGGLLISLISSVATAVGRGRTDLVPEYSRKAVRFILVLGVPVVVAVWTSPEACLRLLYPAEFGGASATLALLAPAMLGLAVCQICWQVLQAAGHAGLVTGLCLAAGILDLIALAAFPGPDPVSGAAAATLAAAAITTVLTLGSAWRRYGAPVGGATLLRVAFSAAGGILAGRLAGEGTAGLFVAVAAYAAVLLATGELAPETRLLLGPWKSAPLEDLNIRRTSP